VDDSRHVVTWVAAWFFAALVAAELVLTAAADVTTLHSEGQDWRANHEQNTAAAHGTELMFGCIAGGALLALLLTLIPRSSRPSTAGRALAMSAGAFFGGFALIAYDIAWAFSHMRVPF
jgi:hypothetical protein